MVNPNHYYDYDYDYYYYYYCCCCYYYFFYLSIYYYYYCCCCYCDTATRVNPSPWARAPCAAPPCGGFLPRVLVPPCGVVAPTETIAMTA